MEKAFELPAYFHRDYFETRYNFHLERGNGLLAIWWRNTYFDNAVAYAWNVVYKATLAETNDSKAAMKAADAHQKAMEKEYK